MLILNLLIEMGPVRPILETHLDELLQWPELKPTSQKHCSDLDILFP